MRTLDLNCDMGELQPHQKRNFDEEIMPYISSCNIACGFHSGTPSLIEKTIRAAINHRIKIGAHPSYYDRENFGRVSKKVESSQLLSQLKYQICAVKGMVENYGRKLDHIKPHGALNNMACENLELATTLAVAIKEIDKDIIYLVPTGSQMEVAAKNNSLRIACEIFADRNYEDNGNLISRTKPNALITDPELAKKHVLNMVKNQAINCLSGKQIPCEIDSVCIHGDNESSLATAKSIRDNLIDNGLKLKPLTLMRKFL